MSQTSMDIRVRNNSYTLGGRRCPLPITEEKLVCSEFLGILTTDKEQDMFSGLKS